MRVYGGLYDFAWLCCWVPIWNDVWNHPRLASPHGVAVVGLMKPNDEVRVRHEEDVLLCDDAILSTAGAGIYPWSGFFK